MTLDDRDDLAFEYRFDYTKAKPNRFLLRPKTNWAVILDLDGTLLDTEEIDRRIWPAAAAQLGFHISNEFYETLVGRSDADCEAALQVHFGPAFQLAHFKNVRAEMWREQVATEGILVMPGTHELLAFLEAEKIPFAVATSSVRDNAVMKLRAAGLESRFAHLATADQVSAAKPAPDLYLAAAKLLTMHPSRCIAVEDSENGVLSAQAAGMTVLMIPDRKIPSVRAQSAAYKILRTLHEVPDTLRLLIR